MRLAVSLALLLCGPFVLMAQKPDGKLRARAEAIHGRLLLDTHIDIKPQSFATAEQDPGVDHPDLQSGLVKMTRGGLAGAFLVVFTPQRGALDESGCLEGRTRVEAGFAAIERLLALHPDRCQTQKNPSQLPHGDPHAPANWSMWKRKTPISWCAA